MSVVPSHEHKTVEQPAVAGSAAATPAPPPSNPPPAPTGRRLSWMRTVAVLTAPLVVTVVAWGSGIAGFLSLRDAANARVAATAAAEVDGAKLYAQHCAYCHGEKGDGNGPARLDPKARDFGTNKFKLATTRNGVACDEDLFGVIRRGIPGSSMPAFPEDKLTDDEVWAVANHVRVLTKAGMYEKIRQKLEDEGEDFDPGYAAKLVATNAQPGERLAVPQSFPPLSAESLARGHQVYMKVCAQCHGPEGRGDGPQAKDPNFRNDDKTPAHPRDFTAGVFKSGRDPHGLYARIVLGMPGTPMPANTALTEQEVCDVIHYVLSLSQPHAAATIGNVAAVP
jgi:mono/diheme cytochrome c family protein